MKKSKIEYYEVTPVKDIKEMMEIALKEAGDKIAFEYRDGKDKNNIIKVTYKEFEEETNNLGTALSSISMTNNHIAVIGDNSYKWLTVYLTVLKSNGAIVPIDKDLSEEEIINLLINSDSELLFYSKRYEKHLENFRNKLPNIKYYIAFDKEDDDEYSLSYDKFLNLGREKLKTGDTSYINIKHDDINKLKLLVYTSGTTGNPKGVMLSEHNLISCVYYGLQVSTVYEKCLSVLPYHHTYEAVAGILVALHHHSTICINDSLKAVLKNLQLYKPDYIYLVPAFAEIFYKKIWATAKESGKETGLKILISVSNALRKVGIDLRKKLFKSVHNAFGGNLIKIVVGGAPIRAELGDFFDSIGINLINGYGISECSPLVSANMDDFNDSSTVGIPLRCIDIKFENVNGDGDGEICVKGDIVMIGYYKEPEKTAKVLKEGWFNTEDIGRINKYGQLVINGRKKNVIVLSNGKNIYPEELENYILRIPYIQEGIVKAIKNDIGQEVSLCAEVFLNEDKVKELEIENVEEELKKDIAKEMKYLPSYKHIQKIEIRKTEFIKTTTNKIKR